MTVLYPDKSKSTGNNPTLPDNTASADENELDKTFNKGIKKQNAMIPTITMIMISNTLSLPVLLRFIYSSTSYHNELSETFLETKFALTKIIMLIMELNNPIAVAYEN
jgi:hypothetical protein